MRPIPIRFSRSPLLALLLTVSLAGCAVPPGLFSYPPQVRGNKLDDDQVAQLVVGTSTQQDATALLGTPTARATFDDKVWLYISQITRPSIAGTQSVQNQSVFILSFDDRGVLAKVQKRNADDALSVSVVSRTTPSPGTDATFLQQLLGNVGRFTPSGANGATSSSGGGSGGGF